MQPIPKKSLGQHWLDDDDALGAMVDAVDVQDTDTVLEIGPGLGTLTKHLVGRAKDVVAVEFDRDLAGNLAKRVQNENLTVVHEDILRL
jgi:16S rRNA (adenine1518-N6/adenine1519-N6)-dimethyltransferase